MALLARNLLAGRRIAVGGTLLGPLTERLAALGAELEALAPADLPDDEGRVGEWATQRAPLDALLYRSAADEQTDAIWAAVREVAVGALIPGQNHGKIVLVGPTAAGDGRASALRAALENLARTLSIEWARYGVTVVMIAPGASTTDQELAELVGFVVSEAGAYLSGCRLELGAVA